MEKTKNEGITLVALVITIIILLILAGITIAQLTGNGLLEKTLFASKTAYFEHIFSIKPVVKEKRV